MALFGSGPVRVGEVVLEITGGVADLLPTYGIGSGIADL